MNQPSRVLVSLSELYQFVRTTYREYALAVLTQWHGMGAAPFASVEYDPRDYLGALVAELAESHERELGGTGAAASTALLGKAGLPPNIAEYVALECFRVLVDLISTHCPAATFGDQAWSYELIHPFDLLITCPNAPAPQLLPVRSPFPTILDDIEEQKLAHARPVLPGQPFSRAPDWFAHWGDNLPQLSSSQIDAMPGGLPPDA